MKDKPVLKPNIPYFSSGPCKKYGSWSLDALQHASIGRSHRSPSALAKIKQALALTRKLLEIPKDFYVAFVPGSDTGAMEMAMWNLLGHLPVDILIYEYFAQDWLYDISQQLKLERVNVHKADFGSLPDLSSINFDHDFIAVLTGTTLGMALPNLDFIPTQRKALTIIDASAAAFACKIDFSKVDVLTFSWQKILGAEAGLGTIILSPKAIERLKSYSPAWPIPKILRLKTTDGKINYGLFEGYILNTISMLCVEDYINSLTWAQQQGGVAGLCQKIEANYNIINEYIAKSAWLDFLIEDSKIRAKTTQTLKIIDKDILNLPLEKQALFLQQMLCYLERENIAYDIAAYRKAPLGLRIWTGPTIASKDLEILCEWLDYSFYRQRIAGDIA